MLDAKQQIQTKGKHCVTDQIQSQVRGRTLRLSATSSDWLILDKLFSITITQLLLNAHWLKKSSGTQLVRIPVSSEQLARKAARQLYF